MIKSVIRIALSYFLIFGQTIAYAQSTAALLPQGKQQFFDNNGDPLTSGKVYFYVPSTTTTKTTWQDSSKAVANANPVVLDGGGRAVIYGDGTYRQILKDRNGNTIYDAITASAGTGGGTTGTGDGDLVGTIKPWAGLVAPNQYAFAYGQELSRTTYSVLYTAITLQQIINCTSGNATASGFSDTSQIPTGAVIESLCFAAGTTVVSKTATTVTFNNTSSLSTSDTVRIFLYGNGNGSTTFNLPDLRAVYIFGRSNMGGTNFPLITTQYLGTNPAATGARGGSQNTALGNANLPAYTPSGTISQITPAGSVKNAASGTTTYTPTGTPTAAGTITNAGSGTSTYTPQGDIVYTLSGTNSYTPAGTNASSSVSGSATTPILTTGAGGGSNSFFTPTSTGSTSSISLSSGTAAGQTFHGNAETASFSGTSRVFSFTNSGSTFSGDSTTFSFTGTADTPTFMGDAQGGSAAAFANLPPSTSLNYIIKITPDTNSADASGVTSLGGMTGDIACGTGLLCTGNIVSISGSPLIINSSPIIGGTSGGFLVNVNNVLSNTDTLGCCNLTTSGTININPLADSGRKGLNVSNSHTTGILAGTFYDNLISVTNSAIVRGDGSSGHEPVWIGTQISASVNTGFDTQNNSGTQVRGQAFGLSVGMVTNGNTTTLADLGAASFGTSSNHSSTSTFYPVTSSGVIGHLGSTTGAVMGAEFNASIECVTGPICGTAIDRYAINLINYHTGTASRLNTAISIMGGNSGGQFKHAMTLNPYTSAAQILQTDGDVIYIPTAQTLASIINVEDTSTIGTLISAPVTTISGYVYNTKNAFLTGAGIGSFGNATSAGGIGINGLIGSNLGLTYSHAGSPTFTLGASSSLGYYTSVGAGTNAWQVDQATNRLSALSGLTVAPTLIFNGSTSGTLTVKTAAISGSNTLTFPAGTTDFSATGGTSRVVQQTSSGGAFIVARLACSDLSDAAATCSSASSESLVVGSTAITSGTTTRILYDNAGTLGEYTLTGTGTVVAMQTSPTFVTNLTTPIAKLSASSNQLVFQSGGVTGTLSWTPLTSGKTITLPNGTTDFTSTSGIVQQASSGDPFTVGSVALSNLATQATNTVVGNATSGTAAPTALAVGSCSTAGSALIWTTNTGFGCNTSITANTATTATTATNATNTAITDDTTTNASMNLIWVTSNTGNLPQKTTSTKLTFNPSTGALSSTSIAINGATIGTNALAVTGTAAISSTLTSAAHTVTSASSTALTVGLNGATNPAFTVDSSTGSQAAGFKITGAATGGTVALVTTDSGSNTNLTINAKGSGTIGIGSVSTGTVNITPATTFSAALTYGGVTLSNAVTGTGNMVLSANPTFTGTLTAATVTLSGDLTVSKANPQFSINKAASGQDTIIAGQTAGFNRWAINIGNTTAESGNAGSNFGINRYNDAGTFQATPFTIARLDGATTIGEATSSAIVSVLSTNTATSKTTGALRVAGGIGVAGAIFSDTLNVITMANSATTSAVCYNTGTGLFTYNSTVGTCTVSLLSAKNLKTPLSNKEGLDIVMAMEPWQYEMKKGLPTYVEGEQIGFVAEYTKDDRIVAHNKDGSLGGIRYEQYTAALTAAFKYLKEDNDNMKIEIQELKRKIK